MAKLNYTAEVNRLFERQLRDWDTVTKNYDALSRVKTRDLFLGDDKVVLQFNPERIRSSAAKVDAASLKARKCFLCDANQPAEQEKIEWNGKYKIQVNPYPIFPRHLTIACLQHTQQTIVGRIGDMLRLAKDLPDWVLFYNGPHCGASAPNHMHFQAGNKGFLPFCDNLKLDEDGIVTFVGDAPGRPFVFHGKDLENVEEACNLMLTLLPVKEGDYEPMVNVLCWVEDDCHYLAMFPRVKHRPDCYGDGEGQFLLSPASVDMGQVFAVPVERDYNTLTAQDVLQMFDELCMNDDDCKKILNNFNDKYSKKMANVPQVRVGIMNEPSVEFVLNNAYKVNGTTAVGVQQVQCVDGKIVWNGTAYDELLFEPQNETDSFTLNGVTIGVSFHWRRKEVQSFRGALHLIVENDCITTVNVLSVEEYLLSVISSEMSAKASLELLKAHAVISRSWLLAQIQKDKAKTADVQLGETAQLPGEEIKWWDRDDHVNFDVCADDHCQRYQGITRASTETVKKAIAATWGQVLTYDGELCDARFSKSCGGVFELFENCWQPIHYNYLVARRDSKNPMNFPDLTREENAAEWILSSPEAFCNTTDPAILSQVLNDYDQETKDFYRWKVEYTQEQISDLIKRRTGVDYGRIRSLEPVARGTSGRLYKMKIVGEKMTKTIGKELAIRYALSESALYSSAFVVEKHDVDADGYPQKFVLRGAGWGHGVGLCQIGAAVMGAQGYDYKEILLHYFIGASVDAQY